MSALPVRVGHVLRTAWDVVRGALGDQAYERYLDATRRTGENPMSPEAFYVESLKRRYSTASRCC